MTCTSCGGSLVEGAKFCPHCGAQARTEAPPADPLRKLLEQALGTHYRVERELGRGGMGTVYLAHESGLDRHVAIKVLPPDRAQSELYRERFRREARTAARLSHPNIVPLHAFGEHEGMLYYVMGYVDGESLAERLLREGRLAEPESRRILAAVADALHYAHEQGVLHRDVKPQNILIEKGSGRPMLTDFGISKITAEGTALTSTGVVVGTPDYMSPEQASGSPDLGPRSDLYSLGVVGYAMLSGRLPFSGRTPGEVLVKRLTSEAPPPAIPGGDVSASLVDAVMKCLAKDPGRRWPDSGAFARAVASFDDEESGPLEGLGLLTILFCFAGIVLHLGWRIAEKPGVAFELLGKIVPAVAAVCLLALLGSLAWAAVRGHSPSTALRQAFREPPVWHTWYPRGLRRTGNVWDRLPREVRRLRLGLGLMIAAGVLVLGPMVVYMAAHPNPPDWVRGSRVVKRVVGATGTALVSSMAIWLLMAWRIPERLRRKGLTESEARRFAYEGPLSRAAFWSRPSVEALLESTPRRTSGTAPGSTDHLDTLTMGSGSATGRRRD
jgi:predicted Ser/Thr protein kinase/drug/metabolite transporter (DMT)-like permease